MSERGQAKGRADEQWFREQYQEPQTWRQIAEERNELMRAPCGILIAIALGVGLWAVLWFAYGDVVYGAFAR